MKIIPTGQLDKRTVTDFAVIIARSFMDNPDDIYFVPNRSTRRVFLQEVMELSLVSTGRTIVFTDDRNAVAIYSEFAREKPLDAQFVFNRLKQIVGSDAANIILRMQKMTRFVEDNRRKITGGSNFIAIDVVAVDPDFQGCGHGKSLISTVVDIAGEKGLPCITETSVDKNVRMYENLGFKVAMRSVFHASKTSKIEMFFLKKDLLK